MRLAARAVPAIVAGLLASVASAGLGALTAESAIVVEAKTGKILFEKDAGTLRYPASTTKIMTALLFIEHVKPGTMVPAPIGVESVGGSSLHLKPGELVSAEDLLYAILLRSANDAAYTAAVTVAGSVDKFADMMNERAKGLGCTCTHFTNPHGLHDPMHYTTARDLALIAREAMKNPLFAKVVGSQYRVIERSIDYEDVFLTTHNKFLKERGDATGVKTGWTVPAGRCFVGSATRDGLSVITVVLKATEWVSDADALTDWAFDNWSSSVLVSQNQVLASVAVKNGDRPALPLASMEEIEQVRERGATAQSFKVVSTDVKTDLPVMIGSPVGSVVLQDQDGERHTVKVYAGASIGTARLSLAGDPTAPIGVLILGLMMGGAWFVRRRARR